MPRSRNKSKKPPWWVENIVVPIVVDVAQQLTERVIDRVLPEKPEGKKDK